MPYAITGQVSQKPLAGGIEITEAEYREAVQAAQEGKRIVTDSGNLQLLSNTKRKVYSTADGAALGVFEDDPVPEGYTDIERPGEHHEWANGEWVKNEQAALEAWRSSASITSRQGEQQLILAGLDEQVEAAIDGIEDVTQRKLTRAWYQRASTWDRDNASLAALADALGLTDAQVDDLFRAAAEL